MLGNKSANAVVDRLLSVYGVKNDNQLSELLQIKRSTLGNWRSRDSVPYTFCVSAAEEKGVSLDWLLTGEGPIWRGAEAQKVEAVPTDPREQALLALWRELDEGEQREIQVAVEEKKRLKVLEQRLAELEAVVADAKRLA
ncbi:TPA: helix-turn-helix domain-containing protein [Pseudomonas aeruginosa]|nr:helix-turn-helix domain-containing protein [Pseudomonas aeruginosa]ELP1277186.1 helix-turn-helix domain-containing protein [Pseudomonas aeruginosa]ELP1322301.1 helix-turn-helix domain-containing protein [Pseudomonas aeruginosa]MBG3950488.1 helix-turn-helix domain-containing protein [Pseudomonas aeruginosa]HBO1601474.1 helix-turn-helix domain-containing protein [Pseudomonas aeruginosa]